MEKKISTSLLSLALAFAALPIQAQVSAADSVMAHAGGHRLSVGGYGEAAYSRNFYSDTVYRYSRASQYKHDPSHGRFDIPHAVIYLGYDFGKGWTMGSEIEFEHTGTGSSVEQDYEESGEWETDTEKGGRWNWNSSGCKRVLLDGPTSVPDTSSCPWDYSTPTTSHSTSSPSIARKVNTPFCPRHGTTRA